MSDTAVFFKQQLTFTAHSGLPVNSDALMDVYVCNSNTLANEQITALAKQYLHPREHAVFSKRKQLQAKQEYLASRFIIKTYASRCLGYDFDALYVQFDDKDTCLKVYNHDQAIALHTCISHSHGQVLIALSTASQALKLGVDLEWISTKRSLDKVAKHYYHEEELDACMAQAEAVEPAVSKAVHAKALYRIWTLKEALAKAIKQPIAKLLRDNVFEHCQPLQVQSGCYADNELTFDVSIISDIKGADNTAINTEAKVLTALFNQDLRSVK